MVTRIVFRNTDVTWIIFALVIVNLFNRYIEWSDFYFFLKNGDLNLLIYFIFLVIYSSRIQWIVSVLLNLFSRNFYTILRLCPTLWEWRVYHLIIYNLSSCVSDILAGNANLDPISYLIYSGSQSVQIQIWGVDKHGYDNNTDENLVHWVESQCLTEIFIKHINKSEFICG